MKQFKRKPFDQCTIAICAAFITLFFIPGWGFSRSVTAKNQMVVQLIPADGPRPISQDLYGANCCLITRPIWYDHPAMAKKYEESGQPFFRFPGGTPANFYNYETGLFDNDSPSTRDYGPHNKRILKRTNGAGRRPGAFFEFVKKHKVRYSLVLNVCTRTFEQNRAWLEKIAGGGNAVPCVEIGNEVFFNSYTWAFPTAQDYVERARKTTAVIRRFLPGTKVGVVIPSQIYQDERFFTAECPPHMKHQREWVKSLEKEKFYDAIVVHLYSPTGMDGKTEPKDFISHLEGYRNTMAHLERWFDPTLDTLESRFPGKEIWVTEYGVGGFGGNLKQYTLRYSHLGCLHTDTMLLRMMKRPSITIAHWHSFVHFFDFIGGEKGIGDKEHISYTHFSLFGDVVRNSHSMIPLKTTPAVPDIEAAAFIGADSGYVVIINKRADQYSLSKLDRVFPGKASFTGGMQLTHRTDMPLEKAMQDMERCERVKLSRPVSGSVNLPPYSITRLEFAFSK